MVLRGRLERLVKLLAFGYRRQSGAVHAGLPEGEATLVADSSGESSDAERGYDLGADERVEDVETNMPYHLQDHVAVGGHRRLRLLHVHLGHRLLEQGRGRGPEGLDEVCLRVRGER